MSVVKVNIYSGSGTLLESGTAAAFAGAGIAVTLSDGPEVLKAKSEDAAGHKSNAYSNEVNVFAGVDDTEAEIAELNGEAVAAYPTVNYSTANKPAIGIEVDFGPELDIVMDSVAVESVDDLKLYMRSGIEPYQYDEIPATLSGKSKTGFVISAVLTPDSSLADGTYDLCAKWVDAENNVYGTYGGVIKVTVDTIAPAAPSISYPVDGQVYAGNTISVTGSVS